LRRREGILSNAPPLPLGFGLVVLLEGLVRGLLGEVDFELDSPPEEPLDEEPLDEEPLELALKRE